MTDQARGLRIAMIYRDAHSQWMRDQDAERVRHELQDLILRSRALERRIQARNAREQRELDVIANRNGF